MKRALNIFLIFISLFIIISKIKAAEDLTQYFTVQDFCACTTETCGDVNAGDFCTNKISADNPLKGGAAFLLKIKWSINTGTYDIQEGDYIEIPFMNYTHSSSQLAYGGGEIALSNIYTADNEKIGQWQISHQNGNYLTRKMKIIFSDYAVGKNYLSGILATIKNYSSMYVYSNKTSSIRVGDLEKTITLYTYNLSEIAQGTFTTPSSTASSNNAIVFSSYTPNKIIKQIYSKYSDSSIDIDQISKLIFTQEVPTLPVGVRLDESNITIHANVYIPTNLSNPKAATGPIAFGFISKFVRINNPESTYTSLSDFKDNIPNHSYGVYTDSVTSKKTLVVNLGQLPSTFNYSDNLSGVSNIESVMPVGDALARVYPFTYDSTVTINNQNLVVKDIINDIYDVVNQKVSSWSIQTKYIIDNPSPVDNSVNVESNWYYNDTQETVTASYMLRSPSSTSVVKNAIKFYLVDEYSKEPVKDVIFELYKNDGGSWNKVGTTYTTDNNGLIQINGLDSGTYKWVKVGYDQSSETEYNRKFVSDSVKIYSDTSLETLMNGNEFSFDYNIGDILYGTISRKTYKVRLQPGTKGTFEPIEYDVIYGTYIDLERPSDENEWIFDYWKDEEGNPYNTSAGVTKDKTYTAQWYKNITITTKHFNKDTNEKILGVDDIEVTDRNGTAYTTTYENDNPILANYDYVDYSISPTGATPSGVRGEENVTVIYNYRIKKATINVKHVYCRDSNCTDKETILEDSIINQPYLTQYTIPLLSGSTYAEYEPLDVSERTGMVTLSTVTDGVINVELKYRKKDSNASVILEGTSETEKVTEYGQGVNYQIINTTTYTSYRGESVVTMKDTLPYKIDLSKSDLNGGTYNEADNTITWIVTKNIDSFVSNNEIISDIITKNITLYYIGNYAIEDSIDTIITSTLEIEGKPAILTMTSINVPLDIKGKIIVRYIGEKGEELFNTIENIEKVGIKYTPIEKTKEGYKIISKPQSEYEYAVEDQELEYRYSRIKINIKVTSNTGGVVEGAEEVYYGEDSTEGKIKITADEGYIISSISINGEELEIPKDRKTLTLSKFINVKEEKDIKVVFNKVEVVNVKPTGVTLLSTIIVSLLVISIGLAFMIKFRQVNNM